MARPVLHNFVLPDWAHRCANGIVGAFIGLAIAVVVVRLFGAPLWVLWFGAVTAAAGVVVSPRRFTLVEGCAGDMGYDEIEPPA